MGGEPRFWPLVRPRRHFEPRKCKKIYQFYDLRMVVISDFPVGYFAYFAKLRSSEKTEIQPIHSEPISSSIAFYQHLLCIEGYRVNRW